MMDMIREDIGLIDLTTVGLEIGHLNAKISFSPKRSIVLCGSETVEAMCQKMGLRTQRFRDSGETLEEGALILEAFGVPNRFTRFGKCVKMF